MRLRRLKVGFLGVFVAVLLFLSGSNAYAVLLCSEYDGCDDCFFPCDEITYHNNCYFKCDVDVGGETECWQYDCLKPCGSLPCIE